MPLSKSGVAQVTVGSNPTLSAALEFCDHPVDKTRRHPVKREEGREDHARIACPAKQHFTIKNREELGIVEERFVMRPKPLTVAEHEIRVVGVVQLPKLPEPFR